MQIEIKNYRGIESANIDMSKICLIAGRNEAGKTSTAQATAAALTGEAIPIIGVKKTGAGMLVRSGTANGSVEVTTTNGSRNIVWPSAKVKSEGNAPWASTFAVGMQSIINLEDKERIKTLTDYLKATPTRADLDKQLESINLSVEMLDQLWKLIETQGWDNTHNQIKEKGTKLKGQWEGHTGEKYGSRKAESWLPEGYEPELESQSESTLKALCTDAQDTLEAAIASGAVEEFKADGLQELAALQEERQKSLAVAMDIPITEAADKSALEATKQVEADLIAERTAESTRMNNLPQPDNATGTPCPSCGVVLEVQGQSLIVLETMSDEEKESRRDAIHASTANLNAINQKIAENQKAIGVAQEAFEKQQSQVDLTSIARNHAIVEASRLLNESIAAAEQLAKAPDKTGKTEQPDIERFRTVAEAARIRLQAFQQKYNADRIHLAIGQNQELIDKIAPEGIRGDVLSKALKGFNAKADPITKTAGWRTVALEPDFTPTYGGTQYLLLSESAKWRVRTVLQMVMAQLDESQALIIDAADILDKTGRNGLFKAAVGVGLPTMICMTLDSKELVPDLAKAGMGVSYWIEGAVVGVVE